MMISNQEQLLLLLRCLGCGVWLGLLWELIGIARIVRPPSKAAVFWQDVIFSIVSGLLIFLFALAVSGGELRAVMLAAIGGGMYAQHLTLGRLLRAGARQIARLLPPIEAFWARSLQKSGETGEKIRKKVVFFYKKGLQIAHHRVYNHKK